MVLSAFTHLWNPIGFPYLYVDEGIYMGRAMHVLEGYGPLESNSIFPIKYDHPYFGQLFLAGALSIIGYPDSLNVSSPLLITVDYDYLLRSIEMLWLVPRVLMGMLAVADTFLIYKIAERRYNSRTIALIAAILFAVMPITWLLRWILLDSILLPFLLSSILFAVYYLRNTSSSPPSLPSSPNYNNNKNKNKSNKCILMVLLSGIFLGLAIFTKIPAFTMIPLVGFLVYTSNNRDLKILGLWFIPVILIPLAWPAYAISIGQFDDWLDGVFWQATQRAERPLFDALSRTFFYFDTVLLILAMGGFIYAAIKKDYFLLLWFIPFLIFLAIIGYVRPWHLIPLIPAFCIAAARLIGGGDLYNLINRKKLQVLLPFVIISAIGIFGLVSTTIIISEYDTSSQFEKTASAIQFSLQQANNNNGTNNTKILSEEIPLHPIYSWIFRYIFELKYYASNHNDNFTIQIN
jgi:Dolichyl-phosphate-mannose-protein mannosyltransferase